MGIFAREKALFSGSTAPLGLETLAGFGTVGARVQPFDALNAVRHFNHWAYAAAMLNANAVANVPLRLYVRRRKNQKRLYKTRPVGRTVKRYLSGRFDEQPGRTIKRKVAEFADDLEEVVEPHPALTVLDQVNPWHNGYELTVLRMLDLQIAGNSYLHPVLSDIDVPAELWRLPPQWMRIVPSATNYIDRYEFGNTVSPLPFRPAEVMHFRNPNPDDLFYGRGWYEAAWKAVALHDAKRTMDLAKFQNMARPDYLLAVKSGMKPEALDQFAEKVNAKHRGPGNAGKFLTITGDVAATPLNWNVEEVGTPTRVIEEISAVSGVPVAMLLSNDPTRASSQTARVGWYRNTIRPYCRLDEEKLNEKWLPMFDGGDEMFLAYDHVSFEDEQAEAKRVAGLVAGGVLFVNEGRQELGYEPVEGGNVLYPPSGSTGEAAGLVGDLAVRPTSRNGDTNEDD